MRLTIAYTSLLVAALFCCQGINAYTPYSGLRLMLNNDFLKSTAKTLMPKLFTMVHEMIQPPNNFSLNFNFWPVVVNLSIVNLTSSSLSQDASTATFETVPSEGTFLLRLPKINKWTIDFAYEYGSAFTDNLKDTARLELVNFGFEFQFKFSADGTTERFYPEALYIDMGSSKLTFNNSPLFLSLVSFGFNTLLPLYTSNFNWSTLWIINIFMRFYSLTVPISVFSNYALDVTPIYDMIFDQSYTKLFLRSEFYNSVQDIRPDVSEPKDLRSATYIQPSSFEVALNEHMIASLFSAMSKSSELRLVLTDEMVFNATQFLHLRTTDFKYYIPGLMQFGDLPMQIAITCPNELPKLVLDTEGQVKVTAKVESEFMVEGQGSPITMDMGIQLALSAAVDEKKLLTAKVNAITLSDLTIKESKITKPDVDAMKKEFNILFKFLMNAANMYALGAPIQIPDEVTFSGITARIPGFKLRINSGSIGIAANMTLLA